jgi:effector-binding domain-containing protein
MNRFELIDVPEQRVATVRRVVPVAELPGFFAEAFHAVATAVRTGGGTITGPPFGQYHGMPTDTVDVSAGFPVEGWEGGEGDVNVGTRAGGPAIVTIHLGSCDTMTETYDALRHWAAGEGIGVAGTMWEEYLTDPSTDPSTWQTRIVWPAPG